MKEPRAVSYHLKARSGSLFFVGEMGGYESDDLPDLQWNGTFEVKIKARELLGMGWKEGPCIGEAIRKLIVSFSAKIVNPHNECFDASVALGILLAKESIPVRLIRGKYGGVRHWWLSYRGTIIDPTAHQFNEDGEYVQEECFPMNFDSLAGYLDIS